MYFTKIESILYLILSIYIDTCLSVKRSPVILVPGDGGTQFEARLNKPSTVHIWCDKKADWFPLWLNLELMAPYVLDCFVDNMRLVYNATTRLTSNPPGVFIRQPHFGNTSAVEWLDSTSYYYHIAQNLVNVGYVRNSNIRGVPYDFRKAPNEIGSLYNDMKVLFETTYFNNNKQKLVLVGHSYGCPILVLFLNTMSQEWKDQHVKSLITLSGPWGGAVKTMRLFASGDNLGVYILNPLSARPQQRSMSSSSFLVPSDLYWNDTEVLVSGPKGNYTVRDYKKFFEDIDFEDGYQMRKDTESYQKNLKAPGVEVHCLHGVNVDTPASFQYTDSQWYDYQPKVIWGDGDGTVNIRSLHGCLKWRSEQKQEVFHLEIKDVNHLAILDNEQAKRYIQVISMK